jgi:hypothetical protein
MRSFLVLLVTTVLTSTVLAAGLDSIQSLADEMGKVVRISADGDYRSALVQLNTLSNAPKNPKELLAWIDSMKEDMNKVSQLGTLDTVEPLSTVGYGTSLARIRFIEKRQKGAVIWTFIGYKFQDLWYMKSLVILGKDDFAELVSQGLDSADAQPVARDNPH